LDPRRRTLYIMLSCTLLYFIWIKRKYIFGHPVFKLPPYNNFSMIYVFRWTGPREYYTPTNGLSYHLTPKQLFSFILVTLSRCVAVFSYRYRLIYGRIVYLYIRPPKYQSPIPRVRVQHCDPGCGCSLPTQCVSRQP